MRLPRPARYGASSRWYDQISFERPVYRAGRVRGIADLGLHAGDRVLDVGCGTGLNFPLLRAAVGDSGEVVGVDASPAMLARARVRIAAQGWDNVALHRRDAARLSAAVGAVSFDAVLFTYSLSVIRDWQAAAEQAIGCLCPGGRITVVDMALPVGRWAAMAPLARLACAAGGADIGREPWRFVLERTGEHAHRVLRGGHLHVATGRVPPS